MDRRPCPGAGALRALHSVRHAGLPVRTNACLAVHHDAGGTCCHLQPSSMKCLASNPARRSVRQVQHNPLALLFCLGDPVVWQPPTAMRSHTHACMQVCAMRASQFIKNVLEPHLGRFARTGVPIKLPAEASAVLSARCSVDAPAGSPVILMRNQASLAAVARGLPAGLSLKGAILCLEVKLKWGFLPFSPLLDDGPGGRLKRTVPRFLLHQLLKREKRRAKAAAAGTPDTAADGDPSDPTDIRGLSLYNPVDLMSGDVERMRGALENLMDMPSNNLRLFLDGRLVIGGRPDAESKSDAYSGGRNKRTIKDVLVHELEAQPGHEDEVCAKRAAAGQAGADAGPRGRGGRAAAVHTPGGGAGAVGRTQAVGRAAVAPAPQAQEAGRAAGAAGAEAAGGGEGAEEAECVRGKGAEGSRVCAGRGGRHACRDGGKKGAGGTYAPWPGA
eukprot:363330-Chlamydomonas_euryale.AAC.7